MGGRHRRAGRPLADTSGEQRRQQQRPLAQRNHAQDFILQLAHIARPVVGRQGGQGFRGKTGHCLAQGLRTAGEQGFGQQRQIHAPFAQRRHVHRDGRQPVIQVFAEAPAAHVGLQVAVGRRDHPDIDGHRAVAAERPELAFLQHAQQLDLERGRGVANFVQKEGAAVGLLEQPDAIFNGSGERTALVAEQFGFEQRVGQGAAVLGNESLVGTGAFVMDGAGDHFLAGTRFAGDHHRQVVGRDAGDQFADPVERTAGTTDEGIDAELPPRLVLLFLDLAPQGRLGSAQVERQALVLLLQPPHLGGALQRQQQLLGLPGFQQVLPDAGFVDPGDDVLGVGIAGQDDAHDVRPAAAHLLQELHAGRSRHALVAEHDADRCGRLLAVEDFHAFVGAGRAEHLEILLQRPAQRFLRTQFVVDDEDGRQTAQAGRGHSGGFQSGANGERRAAAKRTGGMIACAAGLGKKRSPPRQKRVPIE